MTDSKNNDWQTRLRDFMREFVVCWRALPDKALFFTLLTAWMALFHFLGNAAMGHTKTQSLFSWLDYVYSHSGDEEYGRLIPLVVLALYWWKREELLAVEKSPWWPAVFLVMAGLGILVMATAIHQTQAAVVAFFVGLYGLTGVIWGWQWLRASWFPYFLFGFCVPLGGLLEPATSPLRILATWLTVGVARLIGVNVIREGSQIYDAGRTFLYDVAPACSGIRSIISLVAVTVIFGFMRLRQPQNRFVLVVSALPFAVAGNVLRLIMVILTAELFGQEAGGWVEQKLGVFTFVASVAGVLMAGRWLQKREEDKI